MAEGFARTYGSDVLEIHSAGLAPAPIVAPLTKQVMAQRNVNIDHQFPKGLDLVPEERFDIIVNMTGQHINIPAGRVIDWLVRDPIGLPEPIYKEVAAQIENLVMRLILEARS
jgi:protein-tyrosine-phosphatase